jgi:curved DNA-binding protein CbpA
VQNYYEILGVDQTADAATIRAAYKRLAMAYHPDRNAGDKHAEEIFKVVNEAYHTLSDPLKKSRYDARLNPAYNLTPEDWNRIMRRKYHQPRPSRQQYYVIDKEYFRIQALTFLVFIVIAGFCFALLNTAQYFFEQKRLMHYEANLKTLRQAGSLFNSGRFEDALTIIHTLSEKDPMEYRVYYTRDSLVDELRVLANEKFDTKDYSSAVSLYLILKKYEQPVSYQTIRQISMCQFELGNYTESIQAMKQLLHQFPNNIELIYSIAIINLEKLENPEEALLYFTFGRDRFSDKMSSRYGPNFKLIMDPAETPDIYYDLFYGRARTNVLLQHYKEAVSDCNWAIYLRPQQGEPYKIRANANAQLNRMGTICSDIRQAKKLGATDIAGLERKYCR